MQIALLKFNFISGKCNLRNTIGFLLIIYLFNKRRASGIQGLVVRSPAL
ncbi:Putative uncharacterized protein [Moritella viscosa]|nr:Putative uncharacterized protein [Moritella viscosa]